MRDLNAAGAMAAAVVLMLGACSDQGKDAVEDSATRELVVLVNDAAALLQSQGEAAFATFRVAGSRWQRGETYVFVLDPEGNMLVHPDAAMQGKNMLELRDVNGKPIIRGFIEAATTIQGKPEGWYHYEWPVPGEILPRWKSSYVRLVVAPSGRRYIVGGGVYNDRMERSFVVDEVREAVGLIENKGEAAYPVFRDRAGRFIAKDAYVFVVEPSGVERVNPAFPNLEGRNLLDAKDTEGKLLVREMLEVVRTRGAGWVDYMWPKPGESVSTRKSAYVSRARLGESWVLVGCGVYLADAPRASRASTLMTAPKLMQLVRAAAIQFEERGATAYPEFRTKGSKWFSDDTYFFVWTTSGIRTMNAADPTLEGQDGSNTKDVLGRPYGKMFLEVASNPSGEGWVHYMYPQPGSLFPTWKSTFLKRVTFPSGEQYIIGSGIYNMDMDRAFIEDVVNRAAALIAERGKKAFGDLRDKTGPFVFMDTYVFVDAPDGVELVNGAQPSMEGKNIIDLRDAKGKLLAREYIDAARKHGSAWVEYEWYRPGHNTPAHKKAFVRKVESGQETYYVGAGLYLE